MNTLLRPAFLVAAVLCVPHAVASQTPTESISLAAGFETDPVRLRVDGGGPNTSVCRGHTRQEPQVDIEYAGGDGSTLYFHAAAVGGGDLYVEVDVVRQGAEPHHHCIRNYMPATGPLWQVLVLPDPGRGVTLRVHIGSPQRIARVGGLIPGDLYITRSEETMLQILESRERG